MCVKKHKIYDIALVDVQGWSKSEDPIKKHTYELYRGMIRRCYSKAAQLKHPSYKGSFVCDRWLTFSNFINDLPKIDGYGDWVAYHNDNKSRKYRVAPFLDKDIKVTGNKMYSVETCMFVSPGKSAQDANARRDYSKTNAEELRKKTPKNYLGKYIVIVTNDETGESKTYFSACELAREKNVSGGTVYNWLRKGRIINDHYSIAAMPNPERSMKLSDAIADVEKRLNPNDISLKIVLAAAKRRMYICQPEGDYNA